jgi:hypothetical protein
MCVCLGRLYLAFVRLQGQASERCRLLRKRVAPLPETKETEHKTRRTQPEALACQSGTSGNVTLSQDILYNSAPESDFSASVVKEDGS